MDVELWTRKVTNMDNFDELKDCPYNMEKLLGKS